MKNEKSKILIVDDAPENIMLLSDSLRDAYRLIIATSGPKALSLAESEKPDLVLLDIVMPTMDGYETCKKLKINPSTKEIPVIFITSRYEVDDIVKGLAVGAVDYITKPFDQAIVHARVKNHLSLKWHRDQLQASNEMLEVKVAERTSQLNTLLEEKTVLLDEKTALLDEKTVLLQQVIEAAEMTNHMKSTFLANMSHEVRTPMNAIVGYCDILLEDFGEIDENELYDCLQDIKKASSTLMHLLDNVIDITRLEAGKLMLQSNQFNISTVIQQVIAPLLPLAQSKDLPIVVDIDDSIPATLNGDVTRLCQVLTNLLDNAIKFTNDGEITLSVHLINKSETSAEVLFAIRDTGIGISPEQKNILFQPFYQNDNSSTREYGGLGLGLAVSHQLVQLMAGKIEVTSAANAGSEFSITMVFHRPSNL